jgi:hypothetical protein
MARKKAFKKGGILTYLVVLAAGVGVGYLGRNQIAKVIGQVKTMTGAQARARRANFAPAYYRSALYSPRVRRR